MNFQFFFKKRHKFNTPEDIPELPTKLTSEIMDALFAAGAIRKQDLVDGGYYIGKCRNSTVAVWNANKGVFTYTREKFGGTYPEDINHFEDDNGYDLFVPITQVVER